MSTHKIPNRAKAVSMVGNFVLTEFVDLDKTYKDKWLRRINRQTANFYVADTQRYFRDFDKYLNDRVFYPKWAKRFQKTSGGGIKLSGSVVNNAYGQHTISVHSPEDMNALKCEYTYDELFKVDVRTIQDHTDYPCCEFLRFVTAVNNHVKDCPEFDGKSEFTIHNSIHLQESEATDHSAYANEINAYLKELFKVPVYRVFSAINEYTKRTKLTSSGIGFQITHFGGDVKVIDHKVNQSNKTIMFWLFDDRLVYQWVSGQDNC